MRIAVVGGGITGLGCAWALSCTHDVVLFEAEARLGGHSNTVEIDTATGPVPVDTGFIVYNERTYPNLIRLFAALDVPTKPSDMSFGVSLDDGRLEWAGNPRGLTAQPGNLLRPSYLRMIRDILRFNREAPRLVGEDDPRSIGAFIEERRYSEPFRHHYLLPMGAAIWSASMDEILRFPARSFVAFFRNHNLLQAVNQLPWRTVSGGSREYVKRIAATLGDGVRTGTPIRRIDRRPDGVWIEDSQGHGERYDQVVLATHADTSLEILGDGASADERSVLSGFRYASNRAILHRDPALMPRRQRAWASWNYLGRGLDGGDRLVSVTYWMNKLQDIDRAIPVFVSLNPYREPRSDLTVDEFTYTHPQFDDRALESQRALHTIQGINRTWFCGSYCGYGFHEDGLQGGLSVAAKLGAPAPWADEITPMSPSWRAVDATASHTPLAAE